MRIGWRVPLPGPFYLAGTVWRSHKRRAASQYWYGYRPDGSRCPHRHRRPETALECTRTLARRWR